MALTLSQSAPCILWLRHHTTTELGTSNPVTAFSTPKVPSSVTISPTGFQRHAPLPCFCCSPTSSSSAECNMVFSTKIVVKVKLLIDKESGQSFGSALIWFVKEESAQSAVKEMNGKFFDGRFIHVRTAKPVSSRSWKKATPYRF